MSNHTATAAEEQSSTTEEINHNIIDISDMAKNTSAGAEQTLAASQELATLADELKANISRFKIWQHC